MTGTDDAAGVLPPKHVPVDVSRELREAAPPPPERITTPSNDAAVERIAKRESVPLE